MKRIKTKKGFTLLELLIVVVILAVLAGLALPQYLRTVARARESEGWQNLGTIRSALSRYYAEWGDLTNTIDLTLLDISDPNAPPNRLFNYTNVPGIGYDFTVTATPIDPPCTGCRTLTIDEEGTRTET